MTEKRRLLFCRCGRPLRTVQVQDAHPKAGSSIVMVCEASWQSREKCALPPVPRQEHYRIRRQLIG